MRYAFFIFCLLIAAQTFSQDDSALIFSDIHLDADVAHNTNFYGSDADLDLFNSCMKSLEDKKNCHYKYVIISGDFLWHYGDMKKDVVKMADTYKRIADSLLYVCKGQGCQVIPVMGNNDFIKDYKANGASYRLFYDNMLERTGVSGIDTSLFLKGGYYAYSASSSLVVVALNTILFHKPGYEEEAGQELVWLDSVLTACGHKSVWLAYHIPPGMSKPSNKLWVDSYTQVFDSIVYKHKDIIRFQLAGHSHFDDYSVFIKANSRDTEVYSYVHIAPGLCTQHYNNPAYQVLQYHSSDNTVFNIRTYYTDSSAGYKWREEYDFSNATGYDRPLSVGFLKQLFVEGKHKDLLQKMMRFYGVDHSLGFMMPAEWFVMKSRLY